MDDRGLSYPPPDDMPGFVPHQTPNDLQSIMNMYAFLNSITNPSEIINQCKAHLEKQISVIVHTIEVRIVKGTSQ